MIELTYSNIVEYYERSLLNTACCVTEVREEDGQVAITVRNKIREEDKDSIIEAVNEFEVTRVKEKLNDKVRNDKNSGFYKMDSIVRNHLGTEKNHIDFELDNLMFCVTAKINVKNIKNDEVPIS